MGAIKSIFLQHLRQHLRDKYSIFWNLIFPLILMTILVLIFGGQIEENVTFRISIVSPEIEEGMADNSYPVIINTVFDSIEDSDESRWFKFYRKKKNQSRSNFLQEERKKLESGERELVLVVPEVEWGEKVQLEIYRQPERQLSLIAADVITSIINELNREINIAEGNISRDELINVSSREIAIMESESRSNFSFAEFLVPGIILFSFLISGLEIFVEKISSMRARGILKRYFATPLRAVEYFSGILGFIILLSSTQVVLIYGWAKIFFDINLAIFRPEFIFYMLFSLIVSIALGFFLLSIVKNKESVGVVTQAVIYPMAFLGGMFFEVSNLSGVISLAAKINPMYYLVNGMRDALGIYPSPTSLILNLFVPAIWMFGSIIISSYKFSWNPGGES
ncbi:ABC-type multidrug transport system permease subunit [Halanaerobium saccharolyticum]|uniref:ABC-type multidrug transport system permease subunit n=1 Tax=Halanaerobium saccharolyticum TaxID=43595 RepID=A0A4R7YZ46_9FIRM|nr:ABC transporter permease [Halanaerobium saccharolyticum]RAK10262.1 ABC-type multidrug transport system permease subunit [Halanaerobium saccharolyticum]TDW00474.1 ABC-type multidrug transport system permease subunit [Halanaerobium saccharolyticum]TDX52059.1 ABC-type multidrug transport system permease subunit [Halanaerobium saccharolyticum]